MEVRQQLTNKSTNICDYTWPVFVEVLLGALFGMVDMMMVVKNPQKYCNCSAVGMILTNVSRTKLIQALNVRRNCGVLDILEQKNSNRIGSILKHVMVLFCVTPTAILMLISPEILS